MSHLNFQRASTAANAREIDEYANQAQRTIRSIDGLVSDIDPDLSTELFRPIARIKADIRDDANIFSLRRIEIETAAKSRQLIDENATYSVHLQNSVERLVASSRDDIGTASLVAKQAQDFNAGILLSVTVLAIISSFLIVWLMSAAASSRA